MKNRAKCKLCGDIIESFHVNDFVSCRCGEISVDAGNALKCWAKNFNNFLRVDDDGNEIVVTVTPSIYKIADMDKPEDESFIDKKASKKELLDMLQEMINNIEKLPTHVMTSPITHYDHCASLILLLAILRSD